MFVLGMQAKKRLEDLIYLCKDWTNISSTTFGIELKTYPVKEHKNNWNKIGIVILGLVFLQGNMKRQYIVLKLMMNKKDMKCAGTWLAH